jgi:signal peptidase I
MVSLTAALAAGVVGGTLWWARRNLVLVRIEGPSMAPTLVDGDRVLVRRIKSGQPASGRLVLLAPPAVPGTGRPSDPGRLWFVKRLLAVAGEAVPEELAALPALGGLGTVPPGHLLVVGDNPAESYDSRQEGFVPRSRLRGVVVHHLGRPYAAR